MGWVAGVERSEPPVVNWGLDARTSHLDPNHPPNLSLEARTHGLFVTRRVSFEVALFRILAEGHIHRSLGHRPRETCFTEVFGRRPYSHIRGDRREYGLRPNSVSVFNSWGDAPGYGEYGLRPRTQAQIAQLQNA